MDGYSKIANASYFEFAEALQTTSYWEAVCEVEQWLHKISIDGRLK